jgi:hypothetical protein
VKTRTIFCLATTAMWSLMAATTPFTGSDSTPGPPSKDYMLLSASAGDHNPLFNKTVKGPNGQTLGTIEKMILDVKEGKIAYVVVYLRTGRLVPLSWDSLTITRPNGSVRFNATEAQLENAVIDADVMNILGQ